MSMKRGDFLNCSIERVMTRLSKLSEFRDATYMGYTRFSYSKEDRDARKYIFGILEELDMDVAVDGVGNIRARFKESGDAPAILIGSHMDAVPNGGMYDGILGVVAALEVLSLVAENKRKTKYPLELIIFAEEEGSNFGTTLVGSKCLIGKMGTDGLKALTNAEGETAYDVICGCGYEPDKQQDFILKEDQVRAMIEFHIEQGAVLESEGITVSIVEKIVGMKSIQVCLNGVSNHAGATPMHLRHDPMVGAAKVILAMNEAAVDSPYKTNVATIGKINCTPNGANVIPKEVKFFVDIRDVEAAGIDYLEKELVKAVDAVAKEYDLDYSMELIGESEIVSLDDDVIGAIEEAAIENGVSYKRMNSGAVHDAVLLTHVAKVGMIFVPSIGGLSHCPDEFTPQADIEVGVNTLVRAAMKIAEGE